MKRELGVDYVDMITEPGACGVLAEGTDGAVVTALKNKLALSVLRHDIRVVAVVGHHDCAAYPKGREEQEAALQAAGHRIRSWNSEIRIVLLWVNEDGSVDEVGE